MFLFLCLKWQTDISPWPLMRTTLISSCLCISHLIPFLPWQKRAAVQVRLECFRGISSCGCRTSSHLVLHRQNLKAFTSGALPVFLYSEQICFGWVSCRASHGLLSFCAVGEEGGGLLVLCLLSLSWRDCCTKQTLVASGSCQRGFSDVCKWETLLTAVACSWVMGNA